MLVVAGKQKLVLREGLLSSVYIYREPCIWTAYETILRYGQNAHKMYTLWYTLNIRPCLVTGSYLVGVQSIHVSNIPVKM
jgi:hypothetical protein